MSKSGTFPLFYARGPSNQKSVKKFKKVGVSVSNVNVNVNVKEKEKENENAGDIKKEKIFYLRAIVLMIFFNVFNG